MADMTSRENALFQPGRNMNNLARLFEVKPVIH